MSNTPTDFPRSETGASTTPSPASAYEIGVHHLTSGRGDAEAALRKAVASNPDRATTHIALACAFALAGNRPQTEACRTEAVAHLRRATRRERQQVEILSAILEDRLPHAIGLAFEHLDEFGTDQLVLHMLSKVVSEHHDSGLSAQYEALRRQVLGKSEA